MYSLTRLRTFLRKNIWADFLLTFVLHFIITWLFQYFEDKESRTLVASLLNSAGFALIMTPVFRILRPTEENNMMEIYETLDHVRHYQRGQRPQLKAYLESCGYEVDHNDGAISYFRPIESNSLLRKSTFIHETDHWIALVAPEEILQGVPESIVSIYTAKKK